jgi:hypothetical protein
MLAQQLIYIIKGYTYKWPISLLNQAEILPPFGDNSVNIRHIWVVRDS